MELGIWGQRTFFLRDNALDLAVGAGEIRRLGIARSMLAYLPVALAAVELQASWGCGSERWSCGGSPGVAGGGIWSAGRRRRCKEVVVSIQAKNETKRYLYIMAEVGNLLGLKRSNGCG